MTVTRSWPTTLLNVFVFKFNSWTQKKTSIYCQLSVAIHRNSSFRVIWYITGLPSGTSLRPYHWCRSVISMYIPPNETHFNEFRIKAHGTLSQWVSISYPWEFFLYCVVLYAFFDVSDYCPKSIRVSSWYLICGIIKKNNGTFCKVPVFYHRDMYHWVNR